MKPIYIFVAILVLTISCRDKVQDTFPDFENKLVLNSILIKDSVLNVHLSLTRPIDNSDFPTVNNATVKLYIDGVFSEDLTSVGNGLYSSTTIVEPEKEYRCEAFVDGYDKVYATTIIPEATTLTDIIHIENVGKNDEGQTYPALRFTFNNTQETQYYQVLIKLFYYEDISYATLEKITDPVILNEGLPIAVFSNEGIVGNTYTMQLNYTTNNGGSEGMTLYPLIVEFRSISKEYYHFVKQLYLYEQNRYPDNMLSGGKPFQLYSNVMNGYGIFAGYSTFTSDTIFPPNAQLQY